MKKRIVALLIGMFSISMLCCSCGSKEDTEQMDEKTQQSVEKTEKDQNESAQEGNETVETTTSPEVTFEEYVASLPKSNIDGVEFTYEELTQEGFSYPTINGLSHFESEICGMIDYTILDLDADMEEELLTFWLADGAENTKEIVAKIYEKDGSEIKEKASMVCMKELFDTCEIGAVRFYIKDNKYIGVDNWESLRTIGDGTRYAMNVSCYDGNSFINVVDHDMCGSTFYEEGFDDVEWYRQLQEAGMMKTSEKVYNRGKYGTCFAEEGMNVISKIEIRFTEAGENLSPQVVCKFVDDDKSKDYILEESNTRLLTTEDLQNLTKEELRLARNEIYARYGWDFDDEELKIYFMDKCWYSQGENIDDSVLSEIELANKQLILEQESYSR